MIWKVKMNCDLDKDLLEEKKDLLEEKLLLLHLYKSRRRRRAQRAFEPMK